MTALVDHVAVTVGAVSGFLGQIATPTIYYTDNTAISFAAHHVIPENVFNAYTDFFSAIGWDPRSFSP